MQKRDDRRDIEVVLVLGRLHRLGLDEEGALEPALPTIVPRPSEESGQVVQLAAHLGVQEREVSLAATPEDVVVAPERDRRVDRRLHLGRRVGEDPEIGVRRRSVHVARVREQVGRPP